MIDLSHYKYKNILTEYSISIINQIEKIKNLKKKLLQIEKLDLKINSEIESIAKELPFEKEKILKSNLNEDELFAINLFLKKLNRNLIKNHTEKNKEVSFGELIKNYDVDFIPSYTPLSIDLYPFSSTLIEFNIETRSLENEYIQYEYYDDSDYVYKNNIKKENPYIKRYLIPTYISFFLNTPYPPLEFNSAAIMPQCYPGDISAIRDYYILMNCKELSNGDLKSVKRQVKKIIKNMIEDMCEGLYIEENIKISPIELIKKRKEDFFDWSFTYAINNFTIDIYLDPKELEAYISIPTDIILLRKSLGPSITADIGYEKLIKNIGMLTKNKQEQEVLEKYIYSLIYEENKFYEKVKSNKIIIGEFYENIIINPAIIANPDKHLVREIYSDVKRHSNTIKDIENLLENISAPVQQKYIKKVSLDIYNYLTKNRQKQAL